MAPAGPTPVESLTAALVEANDQLVALYELTSITMSSLDERSTASTILDRAAGLLEADLYLWCPDRRAVPDPESPGDYLHTEANNPTDRSGTPEGGGDEHVLSVELQSHDGARFGRLEAKRRDRSFGTADTKLLTAVGNLASGAIDAVRMHERELSQTIIARDHNTASAIACRALPTWRPAVNGLTVFAESLPARAAGGDLFCFSVLDSTVYFAVGDVSGKGLPAAMMMTTIISAATATFQGPGQAGPVAAIAAIDAWVHDYLAEAGLFVTLVVGQFDTLTRELSVVNAGHSPVLMASGDSIQQIAADIAPIGVLPVADTPELTARQFTMAVGDRFVVCSDGLTEQENPSGRMVGVEHLERALGDRSAPIDVIGPDILRHVEEFADGHPQADDRTLVIFEFTKPHHSTEGNRDDRR